MAEHIELDRLPSPPFDVDPNGAYLKSLQTPNGNNILFPKVTLDGKTRGGCHVCLPQFGPDNSGAAVEQPQHGQARVHEWTVTEQDARRTQLELTQPMEGYESLRATLEYSSGVDDYAKSLRMRLTLSNSGVERVRVAPGFHPYFEIGEGELYLDGQAIDPADYTEAQLVHGNLRTLQTDNYLLTLTSEELTTWALWSDTRGNYFCVEPTLSGPSFAQPDQPYNADEWLDSGELRTYSFTINWEDLEKEPSL